MNSPYKPPGVVLSTSNYYVKPKIADESPGFDFLKLVIIVKAVELKSEKGEIKISNTTLNTSKPIQLVEGDNIEFKVNNVTNQITISSINEGLVGNKSVDETTIGHGKVLSYDDSTDKLIYIDITGAIETVVNSVVSQVVEKAINDKFANDVPNMIDQKVETTINNVVPTLVTDTFNNTAPQLIDTSVNDTINQVLPGTVDTAVEDALKTMDKLSLVVRENPIGVVDGINSNFVLNKEPIVDTEQVYLNGILQEKGTNEDYTINGRSIYFTFVPKVDSRIRVTYAIME